MKITSLPLSDWQSHQHFGLAACALSVACLLCFSLLKKQEQSNAFEKQTLAAINAEINTQKNNPAQAPQATFVDQLPRGFVSDQLTSDVLGFAQNAGVQIVSLTPLRVSASAKELGRLNLAIVGSADYKSTKACLAQLLNRYPALAVQNLTMRAAANDLPRQDIALNLTLYLKPE